MKLISFLRKKRPVLSPLENGFTLAFAAFIAAAMAILLLGISRMVTVNNRQAVYLDNMREVFRLAETGMNTMVGKLIVNPSLSLSSTQWYTEAPTGYGGGEYQNYVTRRNIPIPNGYYIVTTATKSVGGLSSKKYAVRLHAYVAISNAAEYLLAVSDKASIGDGTDAATGKVYAPVVNFQVVNGLPRTKLADVQYVNQIQVNNTVAATVNTTEVRINCDGPYSANPCIQPTQLAYRITFPQVLDSDALYYQEIAHATGTATNWVHEKCVWVSSDNIYPPGYVGSAIAGYPDNYAKHTSTNADHVYYCHNNMYVAGTVFGQVIFVTTNTIFISSDLVKSTSLSFPGEGSTSAYASSSTAHQAVLITRHDVIISTGFWGPYVAGQFKTQRIEAMVLAPHGTLGVVEYQDPNPVTNLNNEIHENLQLKYKGSLVVGSNPEPGNVFQGGTPPREYQYDTDFRDHPPPYLPALADIHYVFEETILGN